MIKKINKKHIYENRKTVENFFKNTLLKSISAADDEDIDTKNSLYVTIVNKKFKRQKNDRASSMWNCFRVSSNNSSWIIRKCMESIQKRFRDAGH